MTPSSPSWTDRLAPEDVAHVRRVVEAATAADGVASLGEAFLLRLDGGSARHLVAPEGYAQLAEDGSAELVVAPDHRREGVGRRLAEGVLAIEPEARLWAHGDLPGARALAGSLGLDRVRELLVLRRDLTGVPDAPAPPSGYHLRTYVPGTDEDALLAVNAAAFVDHPEQGRLDHAGLADRAAQPWFDPDGIFLVEDDEDALAAFHWTKVEDPSSGIGEVYVVGVAPGHQGHGLGGYVTAVGLQHLRDLGLSTVELYVEGDNAPALATYRRVGMSEWATHAMYAPSDRLALPQ